MTTKRILFFASEPGGAEVLCPVIRLLQKNAYDVTVLSHGHGAVRFEKQGIGYRNMIIPSAEVAIEALREYNPDYVITSATSLPWVDMSEKYLWVAAKSCGIGTLAFIDQWQNYAVRFSGPKQDERLQYLPEHINCINETGKKEMLAEGFPEDRLVLLGHPSLATICDDYAARSATAVVAKLGILPSVFSLDETLLFVSEALLENYGNSRGYNQYGALKYFLENVLACRKKAHVMIKLHPKDDRQKFQSLQEQFKEINILVVHNELSSLECLTLSNRVFGMTSMMLIEAFLLGKTVVSLQPGLIVDDPLVLSRHGLIPRRETYDDFDPFIFAGGDSSKFRIDFDESKFLNFLSGKVGMATDASLQKGMCRI